MREAESPAPDMDHTATYTYETLNRLTNSTASGSQSHNLTYSYTSTGDPTGRLGNVTCSGGTGLCTSMTYDASTNRLSSIGSWSVPADGYDAAGNLRKDDLTCNYSWDGEGRLTGVSGCATLNFVYNALGQRAEKKIGTSTYREYAYDGFGQLIGVHYRTAWLSADFPFAGRTLAKYESSITKFLHPNHLGSTSFVADHAGAVIQKMIYYPWGQRWAYGGAVHEERFASLGQRDSETAEDPTLFRMYSARLYRWLSPDPVAGDIFDPQSLNRYCYARNNPTNLTDPSGLDPVFCYKSRDCHAPISYGWNEEWEDQPCQTVEVCIDVSMGPDNTSGGGLGSGRAKSREKTFDPCDARLPSDADAELVAKLIYAEATAPWLNRNMTAENRAEEMAAIAFTVINRANYLEAHPGVSLSFFGAEARSIRGVVSASQFGSVGGPQFERAGNPRKINVASAAGRQECDFLKDAIRTAEQALAGTYVDPYASQGGVYAFRPWGSPRGSFVIFPPESQIPEANNIFYGLRQ